MNKIEQLVGSSVRSSFWDVVVSSIEDSVEDSVETATREKVNE